LSKEKFRKVYALLPESEHKLTIVTIDDRKISWEEANREIMKDSDLGKTIQKKLEDLKII